MPIRRENRERYPPDWPETSLRIRFERAGGRCECAGECGHDHGDRCPQRDGERHSVTGSIVVLAVAHLDDTPEHSDDEDLRAFCQRCHLAYDDHVHAAGVRMTVSRKRVAAAMNRELFAGEDLGAAARTADLRRRPHPDRVRYVDAISARDVGK